MSPEQFSVWLDEHYGELVSVARRLVNNPEDAAEVVNAAVAQTLSNGRLAEIKSPWSWMVGAVRGTAANARRGRRRAVGGSDSIRTGKGRKPGASPDAILRRLPKLTPEQDTERWVQRQYLNRLETDRGVLDMDGYGRQQTLHGSNGHPDDSGGDARGSLDPTFTVRFPHEEDVYDVLLGVQETYSGDFRDEGDVVEPLYDDEPNNPEPDYDDEDDRIDRGGDPNDPGGEA